MRTAKVLLCTLLLAALFTGCKENGGNPEGPIMLSFNGMMGARIAGTQELTNVMVVDNGRKLQYTDPRSQTSYTATLPEGSFAVGTEAPVEVVLLNGTKVPGVFVLLVDAKDPSRVLRFGNASRDHFVEVRYTPRLHFTGARIVFTRTVMSSVPISGTINTVSGSNIVYTDATGVIQYNATVNYDGSVSLYLVGDPDPFPNIFVGEYDSEGRVKKFDDRHSSVMDHSFGY